MIVMPNNIYTSVKIVCKEHSIQLTAELIMKDMMKMSNILWNGHVWQFVLCYDSDPVPKAEA